MVLHVSGRKGGSQSGLLTVLPAYDSGHVIANTEPVGVIFVYLNSQQLVRSSSVSLFCVRKPMVC